MQGKRDFVFSGPRPETDALFCGLERRAQIGLVKVMD